MQPLPPSCSPRPPMQRNRVQYPHIDVRTYETVILWPGLFRPFPNLSVAAPSAFFFSSLVHRPIARCQPRSSWSSRRKKARKRRWKSLNSFPTKERRFRWDFCFRGKFTSCHLFDVRLYSYLFVGGIFVVVASRCLVGPCRRLDICTQAQIGGVRSGWDRDAQVGPGCYMRVRALTNEKYRKISGWPIKEFSWIRDELYCWFNLTRFSGVCIPVWRVWSPICVYFFAVSGMVEGGRCCFWNRVFFPRKGISCSIIVLNVFFCLNDTGSSLVCSPRVLSLCKCMICQPGSTRKASEKEAWGDI